MGNSNKYLYLYMWAFFVIALQFSTLGSLIPIFATKLGIQQTEYSLIFVLGSIATLSAALIYRLILGIQNVPDNHKFALFGVIGSSLFSFVVYNMQTRISQCIAYSFLAMFTYIQVMTVNRCLLDAAPETKQGLWMSFSHGVFGIGAMIGPSFAPLMQQNFYALLSLLFLSLIPFYYFYESPELVKAKKEVQEKQEFKKIIIPGSKKLEIIFSAILFAVVGIQITIQAWLPTFVVMKEISSKQDAGRFVSIFWATQTLFRFVLGFFERKDS